MNPDAQQDQLVALGSALLEAGYGFVTPTPETHRRILGRRQETRGGPDELRTLRDVFGWNRRFRTGQVPARMLMLLDAANLLARSSDGEFLTSRVRFSTVDGPAGRHLFAHSAYPTTGVDAVFFGPDSYRFVALLDRTLNRARRLVDVGCGTGVGGLLMASRAEEVVLADVSPCALRMAAVNVALGRAAGTLDEGTVVSLTKSDVLMDVEGDIDAVVANPPYLVDAGGIDGARTYREGGGALGIELAARIAEAALARLSMARSGQLILYTGVPIVDGRNVLRDRLEPALCAGATRWTWEELDPDVFGEELDGAAYRDVERLAVVALVAQVGNRPPHA
jgi:SAM-dependent methyltransferase